MSAIWVVASKINPMSALKYIFLPTHIWEVAGKGLGSWVPATHARDPDGVPALWLWPDPALTWCKHLGNGPADGRGSSISVSASLYHPNNF